MARKIFPCPHPLLRIRARRGISIRRLARQSKTDFRKLSLIERGFSLTELQRLARALRCGLDDLQTGARHV